MTQQARIGFDFDHWSKLARDDPQGFERARARLLDRAIEQAPEARRARLRGLQWRVDQVRRRAGTPLSACVEMSKLMWDAVLGERGLLESLHGRIDTGHETPLKDAAILPFPKKAHN